MICTPKDRLTHAGAKGVITVDLDLFVRSDKGFPYMIPNPSTRSPHSTVIALADGKDAPVVAIDSAKGTWQLWNGDRFLDSEKVVNYDVWNHMQIAIDPAAKSYKLVVQPIGEMPTLVGQAKCGASIESNDSLKLVIKPSQTVGHISCYDNILITTN